MLMTGSAEQVAGQTALTQWQQSQSRGPVGVGPVFQLSGLTVGSPFQACTGTGAERRNWGRGEKK